MLDQSLQTNSPPFSSAVTGKSTALRFQMSAIKCNSVWTASRACGVKSKLRTTAADRKVVIRVLSAIDTAMLLSISTDFSPFWAVFQLAHFLTGTGAPVNLMVLAFWACV